LWKEKWPNRWRLDVPREIWQERGKYLIPRITGKKYRGAKINFVRGFITKHDGVEPEIAIYL
jgi:hypothetical protein